MSFPVANDLKEQVREATDIVALLGSYLSLIPKGRNFVAVCPFHDDTRPSLQVNPERQSWKCWPCDVGGDVFSFIMQREHVDFPEALRILAERAGIELKSGGKPAPRGSARDKATLYKAMAWAEREFHRYLLEARDAEAARVYLRDRHIDGQSVERYQIGYAPNEWSWLTGRGRQAGFSDDVLEAVGLVIRKETGKVYDRFRGRVLFPIRDTQDRAIAVGGRILPQFAGENAAKYINSPETRLYTKSEQLYGLNVSREGLEAQRRQGQLRNVVVMEGYTDVVVSRQQGIATPVAVCGTALGARHVQLLKRYADRVTLILDGDEAGQNRTAEVLDLFVAGQIELRIVTLPGEQDPCDFVLAHGAKALEDLVEQSPDALDFCVARETRDIDLANDTQRATQSLQRILSTMAAAPRLQDDTATAFRLREQQTLSRLSRMFHVDEALLRQQLADSRRDVPAARSAIRVDEPEGKPRLHSWERELFVLLIQNPDAITVVIERISIDDMRTATGKSFLVTYQELESQGSISDYQHMMDAVEDVRLKNILVELADDADRTHTEDFDLQLSEILAAFTKRREDMARRKQVADIQSGKLKDQEELDLLNKLFESKRLNS